MHTFWTAVWSLIDADCLAVCVDLIRWVWVPDELEGYVGGWVTKDTDEDHRTVTVADSGQVSV